MRISASDIVIQHRNARFGLGAAIGEIILRKARLVAVPIPRTYRGTRVGVALKTGNRPLPTEVNARLLSTAYDVMVHNDGACSIPFKDAQAKPKVAVAAA